MKIWFNFLGLCQCVRIIYLVSSVRRASQRLSTSGRGNSCGQKSMISDFWICFRRGSKTWERRRESQRNAKYCILIPWKHIFWPKMTGNMRYHRRCALHTCSLRMSAETWSTSLNLVGWPLADCLSHKKHRFGKKLCDSGTNLSASLAIMAWIPLAESSRVLMKKSLDWKWLWIR